MTDKDANEAEAAGTTRGFASTVANIATVVGKLDEVLRVVLEVRDRLAAQASAPDVAGEPRPATRGPGKPPGAA